MGMQLVLVLGSLARHRRHVRDSTSYVWRSYSRVGVCFFFSSRRRHTRSDRDWSSDVCSSDLLVIFLAVGTPPKEDGSADLSFIEEAARDIARHMNGYKVVVTKSTVPVGTGERLRRLIREHQPKFDFGIVSNPEFLREGAAIDDFMRPNRVVIGSRDEAAIAIMRDLFRPLYLIETPVVITSLEAAELTKYASNAFLATKISFINEIANLCDRIGCDVHDVARAMGMDNRIGRFFLHPGPGYRKKRSEEHTSELQSRSDLVCRLLLEKKKKNKKKSEPATSNNVQ